jgi:hypothetical protein
MAQWRTDTYEFKQPHNVHLYELNMTADIYGNPVDGSNPTGMAVDAFGRARSSDPFTLFDSFHKYRDNGRINQANSATGATTTHNANAGLIECTLDTAANSFIYRESSRVFAYQPGKSLQVLQTYVFAPHKTNLRQRYGYFNTQNGIFLEQNDTGICWVERSTSSGSGVTENRVYQQNWSQDKLDGTGPSRLTLDLTKAQIQFIDIEWLGLGTVRCGFVINGKFIHCHSFHHANLINTTYMATAVLPVRAEIENVGTTASNSTLKIVCATVISEGGYQLRGRSRSIGIPITTPKDIPTAGTFVPIISIRVKDDFSDAIVIPTDVEFFGVSNNTRYRYKLVAGGTLTGASWSDVATNESSVEYDITATAITGGRDLQMGYINIAAGAGGTTVNLAGDGLFDYQLERNSFAANNKGVVFSLVATGAANGDDALGSITFQEIT